MKIRPLSITGAWLVESRVFRDNRGSFSEWFKKKSLENLTGEDFQPVQANISVSHSGVIRGIHYSLAPNGQSKFITVLHGSILDVAIDVRIGSPTFGEHVSVILRAGEGQSMFLRSDLAHAFQALEDNTVVAYLVSSEYSPNDEKEIFPLCTTLKIQWTKALAIELSDKDQAAPDLIKQKSAGLLPNYRTLETKRSI